MYQDPYQTKAQFEAEAAEIDAIQAAQYADEDKASVTVTVTPAATASAVTRAVTQFDARLIREARELAELNGTDAKRAWLIANDRPEAATMSDSMVSGMIAGNMQYALTSLANGYERELQRNA